MSDYQTITPVRDSDGQMRHYVSINQDITERKQLDRNLRESFEHYRSLFNNMLLPFEVASVILLVAMVGAIILVKKEKAVAELATREWDPEAEPTAEIAEEEV